MRITIDIDGAGSTGTPAPGSEAMGTSPAPGSLDDTSAARLAERTGAVNAGPAPTGPGAPPGGAGPTVSDSTMESAGAAPIERGAGS